MKLLDTIIKILKPSHVDTSDLSEAQFGGVNPFEEKRCYDCNSLKSALSWWCSNQKAKEYRGTSIPGICKCPFWTPDIKMVRKQLKTT